MLFNEIIPENQNYEVALPGASLNYYPQFLSQLQANKCLENLLQELNWQSQPIKIFGKMIMQPRLMAWYGNPDVPIKYSGVTFEPNNWTPTLLVLKAKIESLLGTEFNGVLCNLYRDGMDSMGWHSDNEAYLGKLPIIPSLSLGAERIFQLKHKTEKGLSKNLKLEHGSLLLMQGETQNHYKHQLPKTKLISAPRINLTFRQINPRLL